MRKVLSVIVALVVIALLVWGGYSLFHKSDKTTPANTSTNSTANAPAVNNSVLTTKTDSKLGQYLADPSGKPLYTYNADSNGVSNCSGACLANWPAYVDKGSTTNLPTGVGVIKRSDSGQMQYTYNGLPLYYFVSDSSGQVTGDGVENFSVAKPVANPVANPSSSSSSSTNTSTDSSSSSSSSSAYPY